MGLLGVFGINDGGLSLVVNLLIVCLVAVWFATIYWTHADAQRRIADPTLVNWATAAAVFPFVGALVYMIVRPPEYLEDVRERELEMQAAEARLYGAGFGLCPHCDAEIERDFVRCPSCMRRLKERCDSCGRPLEPGWRLCPYCEAEVRSPEARRPRRRRASEASVDQPAFSEAPPGS
jgi:hypothetical protein